MRQLPLPFPPDTINFAITQDGKYAGTYTVTIDWQDRDLMQYKWRVQMPSGKPYVYGRVGNRHMALHRFILERKSGIKFAMGVLQWSDHADRNTLNNTRDNLRIATPSQNAFNQGIRPDNTSGHRGVYWHKSEKRWLAKIGVDGETIRLGSFKNKEDAIIARKEAEQKYYGEFAKVA